MALPVSVQFANPPANANPINPQQLIDLLNALITATVTGTYLPYVIGSTTPAVGDQNKAWIRTDGGGRPIGTFVYYAGHWRRASTGLASELRYFNGNPATYFDGTGKGIVEGEWDGFCLCNGQNGTTDLSDKFICIGGVYTGGVWKSDVSGTSVASGGVKDITLSDANTFQLARPKIEVGRATADGNAPDAAGVLYGTNMSAAVVTLQSADTGNLTPPAIPTLPPYIVVGLAAWKGYD